MEQDDDARSYMEQDDNTGSYMEQDDNTRSYMEQDDNARSYMEQDDNTRSYLEQDDNARSYIEQDDNTPSDMEQENEAPRPYINKTPPEQEGDNDKFAAIQVHYQNRWDGDLHVDCSPSGGAINEFQSVHNNGKEDRLWRFDCRHVGCFYLHHAVIVIIIMSLRLENLIIVAGIMESMGGTFQCCSCVQPTTT